MTKLSNVKGRITYISSHAKQENLYAVYETTERKFWRELAKCNQEEFAKSGTEGKCIEARELIIVLPESFTEYQPNRLLQLFTNHFKQNYGTECIAALHHNKRKTNYHIHLIFAERKLLDEPIIKTASRNMFYDENGKHVRTKKEILGSDGEIREGCKIINLEGQKMYRYFLGAFGNKSFIRPQYEIMEDGKLRGIEDRWGEFPNGGTVSLTSISDSDTESIKNRLLQFKIDFNRDLHPGYAPYTDNSNKYQIPFNAIDDFDKDEVVEIIDIDYAIEDFINDKTKRTIRIKHRPNKQILLRYAQDCYGPFEFMISDIEDSYSDESYYTIKVFVNSGTINRYKNSDIEKIIMDGYFSIRRNDRIEFIYNINDLKNIEPESD